MTTTFRPWLCRAAAKSLAAATLAAACSPAWAALGDPQASVSTDAQALQGTISTSQQSPFTVDSITLPNGTIVKEFIAASGNVVAVSWRGLRPPKLSVVLGAHYADYQGMAAVRQPGSHHHHLLLSGGTLVFESSGHLREFRGSAYLPAQMPQGASAGDLH